MSWTEDNYDAYDPEEMEDNYLCSLLEEQKWPSQYGELLIRDMKSSHINNAINWIDKHYTKEDRMYEFKELLVEEYMSRLL